MITADPQLDDVKAALKLGAYDFVGKPLDFDELHVTDQERARGHASLRTEVANAARAKYAAAPDITNVVSVSAQNDRADELRSQGRVE